MNGEGCDHDICAICLDPPTEGGLALACRHSFHAECLLASFSGKLSVLRDLNASTLYE